MKKVVIAVLAVMSLTAVFGQEKTNLAVYVQGNADEEMKKVVGSKFIAAMVRSNKYAAVERTDDFLAELRRELGYQYSGSVDDGQLIKLGKQLGVKLICAVDVSNNRNNYYIISSRMIDIETGLVISATAMWNIYYSNWREKMEDLIANANDRAANLLQNVTTTVGKQKMAIYVTKSSDTDKAKRVSSWLMENLTNSGAFITVERTSDFLAALQKEQNYQRSGNVNDNQLSRLGQQFGVNMVCVIDIAGDYTMMRVINVETSVIMATAENRSVNEMTAELLQQLGACIKKDQPTNKFITQCCYGLFNVDGICRDYPCSVRVAAADFPDRYKWKEAMKACTAGWRLPTRSELECLCKNSNAIGGLDTYTYYWSSEEYDRSNAYSRVHDGDGYSPEYKRSKTDKNRVRCVKDRQ